MRTSFLPALGTLVALAVAAGPAYAAPNANNSPKLREAVSVDGIREHMANLQTIADANGGSRLAGASGHDASAAYVKQRLEAAGYDARYQEFTYHAFCDTLATVTGTPPALALANPASAALLAGNGLIGLDQMSDAAAHATITLAQSTGMINGERGKGNFDTDAKIQEQAAR